jgi:hypothetical protein
VYSLAVEALLGKKPTKMVIESIEDGREGVVEGEGEVEKVEGKAREALTQVCMYRCCVCVCMCGCDGD